ncbi:aldo/keto reductase [Blastococcus brunescens]|uniref:Aldo/keto reductase n=1 Tax=Blastococcus brunescens TaxID=1564165 RepID=A0ABZ1B3N5_9ACTN|nr:aldo/keto reductase [Blastococcus sp. BMG 8361]WRL65424.1 aldo/keto reductase [Blastococcus sp. BMG 8361]
MWSPIAAGLLTGKYRRGQQPPERSRQLTGWDESPVRDEGALYDIVDELVAIGDARGLSAAQVSLAWLLGRPGVSSLIVGARTEQQLADNLAAAELHLTEDERTRLDRVSAPALIYPYWHHAKSRLRPGSVVPNGRRPAATPNGTSARSTSVTQHRQSADSAVAGKPLLELMDAGRSGGTGVSSSRLPGSCCTAVFMREIPRARRLR